MIKRVYLRAYVSLSMTGRWFSNIHTYINTYMHTYIHTCSAHILIYQKHSFRACMFERVCLVFDDRQRVFKHTYMLISLIVDSILADFVQACMYAWGLRKYPPSQISKNCIVVQILNVSREESDPTPG